MPGYASDNSSESVRVDALLDTGATGFGIREDLARDLKLRPKGQRRVLTAGAAMMATEYVVRVGFVAGDYLQPDFAPELQLPYMLEREIVGFGLKDEFTYPALVGMAVLGWSDLHLSRDGIATLRLD